jgi:hypothetical protein
MTLAYQYEHWLFYQAAQIQGCWGRIKPFVFVVTASSVLAHLGFVLLFFILFHFCNAGN